MNTTVPEGVALARDIGERCAGVDGVEVAILPPFVHLTAIRAVLASSLLLGAQDIYFADAGAFTGEVSASMIAGVCDLVLVGHSERRHLFGETDEQTGRKFVAARHVGLRAVVAVGETEAERDAGRTTEVIDRQLDAVVGQATSPPHPSEWVVAYEPVWAIGTGRTASPAQAQEVCAHIREHLVAVLEDAPRVLYGGSVTAGNAAELFACDDIDGGLIGGASLKPDAFAAIVAAAGNAAR